MNQPFEDTFFLVMMSFRHPSKAYRFLIRLRIAHNSVIISNNSASVKNPPTLAPSTDDAM